MEDSFVCHPRLFCPYHNDKIIKKFLLNFCIVQQNRQHIKKKLFTIRVVRQWNRLLRDLGDASSLDVLKVRLDQALSN